MATAKTAAAKKKAAASKKAAAAKKKAAAQVFEPTLEQLLNVAENLNVSLEPDPAIDLDTDDEDSLTEQILEIAKMIEPGDFTRDDDPITDDTANILGEMGADLPDPEVVEEEGEEIVEPTKAQKAAAAKKAKAQMAAAAKAAEEEGEEEEEPPKQTKDQKAAAAKAAKAEKAEKAAAAKAAREEKAAAVAAAREAKKAAKREFVLVDVIRNQGPITRAKAVEEVNAVVVEAGGKDNEKQTDHVFSVIVPILIYAGVVEQDGDNFQEA
jgi:membrane protein involved in colicin uptake